MSTEFQFRVMKKLRRWKVVMAVQTYLLPLNCTLEKMAKMVNFMLHIFYHNKKKSSDTFFELESSHNILMGVKVGYTASTE